MPILTFTNSDLLHAGVLNSRVLIGRRLSHGVVLSDPTVSRLHAWIDPIADENSEWVITDAGSKTGTFVNDQQIARHPLQDGDRIRVGNVELLYQDLEALPAGASVVELSSPSGVVRTSGILFECACGAPLWVGNDLAGKRGLCRHCRQPVTVPEIQPVARQEMPVDEPSPVIEAQVETPVETPVKQEEQKRPVSRKPGKCAVCHSEIQPEEEQTQCPDCAMRFHAECWQENLGCSSYGCPQVNALNPSAAEEIKTVAGAGDTAQRLPWETILLAASVVGSLAGAMAFGSLAAIVAVVAIVILVKKKAQRPVLLVLAVVICVFGIAVGLGVSDFMYFNAEHLPQLLRQHIQ